MREQVSVPVVVPDPQSVRASDTVMAVHKGPGACVLRTSLVVVLLSASLLVACKGKKNVACPAGQTRCGTVCVDLTSSTDNCGACGVRCSAQQTCTNAACVVTCSAGQVKCGGTCIDPASDQVHCGAGPGCEGATAGQTCAAGLTCVAGACSLQCAAGLSDCGGSCTDRTTDPRNCGSCGSVCAADQACAEGVCTKTCAGGLAACPVGAPTYCVDLAAAASDCGACGNQCPASQSCNAGRCECPAATPELCGAGQSAACSDLSTDPNHCGSCGASCGGRPCIAGVCELGWCSPAQMRFTNAGAAVRSPSAPRGGVSGAVAKDLNHDGVLDLVIADSGGNVVVRLGRGDKTFAAEVRLVVPAAPQQVAVADIDGDGAQDIVSVNGDGFSPWSLSSFLGGGSGTFGPAISRSLPTSAGHLELGDMNADGLVDVVVGPISSLLAGTGDGTFAEPVELPTTGYPAHAIIMDMDGDGASDYIAVYNGTPSSVAVYKGSSSGGLQAPTVHPLSGTVMQVAAGDLDGDGIRDLVVAGFLSGSFDASGRVSVLMGNGDGSFQPPTEHVAGRWLSAVALADADQDGVLDAVVASHSGPLNEGRLVVLRGAGDGTFATPVTYRMDGAGSYFVAGGDLNSDGTMDLLTLDAYTGAPLLLLGLGGGTFPGEQPQVPAGRLPGPILSADFNGDGIIDIVTADQGTATGRMMLGSGGGRFSAPLAFPAPFPSVLAAGDLDGDGKLDLALGNGSMGGVRVLLGRGDGTFGDPVDFSGPLLDGLAIGDLEGDGVPDLLMVSQRGEVRILRSAGGPQFSSLDTYATTAGTQVAFTAADLNGDGRTDVVLEGFTNTTLIVMLAQPDGTLLASEITSGNVQATSIGVGDLDEDGSLDILVGSAGWDGFAFYRGLGGGAFLWPPSSYLRSGANSSAAASIEDLDKDGHLDLITADRNANVITLVSGNGGGTFKTAVNLSTDAQPVRLALADFNGDGREDILTLCSGGVSGPDFLTNTSIDLLLSTAPGQQDRFWSYSAPFGPMVLAVADMNGDGKADLITSGENQNGRAGGVAVYLADGTGGFPAHQFSPGGGTKFAVGDLNGDGHPDVVAVAMNNVPEYVLVQLGNGDGSLSLQGSFALPGFRSVALVDLDGDGKLDLVAGGGLEVAVLPGIGDGTFGVQRAFSTGVALTELAIGDIDGDGWSDVLGVSYGGSSLVVLRSDRTAGLLPAESYAVAQGPMAIAIGDFNGDGAPDAATSHQGPWGVGGLAMAYGVGDGTFDAGFYVATPRPSWSLAVADMNGDGVADLVAPVRDAWTVDVLFGSATAGPALYGWSLARSPIAVAAGDLDGDGRPDIAVTVEQATGYLHGVVPLLGRCGP